MGAKVEAALARQAAVALIGPRQVGKTTLAHEIARTRPSIYLDLEAAADRDKLSDPVLFLDRHVDKLVILDGFTGSLPCSRRCAGSSTLDDAPDTEQSASSSWDRQPSTCCASPGKAWPDESPMSTSPR
jgi:hypothetical protein